MLLVKQVDGFPDYYVTSEGEVWSTRTLKIPKNIIVREKGQVTVLMPSKDAYGNRVVALSTEDRKPKRRSIMRLVAMAFIPKPEGAMNKVRKIDGTKPDSLDNVEWIIPIGVMKNGKRRY